MAAEEDLGSRSEEAGRDAEGAAAAQARAYLDLWERHLVHAAVRSRLGPVRPAASGTTSGHARRVAPRA